MYKNKPWTLEKERVNNKPNKKEKTVDPIKVTKLPFFRENKEVSVARVIKFFESNKSEKFLNKQIATALGLSQETVSGITCRLHQFGIIKPVEVYQEVSAYSLYYQHVGGTEERIAFEKKKKDAVIVVSEIFKEDINRVLTKKEFIEVCKERKVSEGQAEVSLKILILNKAIKILDDYTDKTLKFQHALGDQEGLNVLNEWNESYCSINQFLKENKFKGDIKEFYKGLPKCAIYPSTNGFKKVYLKEDLKKRLTETSKKESIIGKLLSNFKEN